MTRSVSFLRVESRSHIFLQWKNAFLFSSTWNFVHRESRPCHAFTHCKKIDRAITSYYRFIRLSDRTRPIGSIHPDLCISVLQMKIIETEQREREREREREKDETGAKSPSIVARLNNLRLPNRCANFSVKRPLDRISWHWNQALVRSVATDDRS